MSDPIEPAARLDNQASELFGQTPSQTVGPFFHYALPWKGGADLVGDSDIGARVELFPSDHYMLGMPFLRSNIEGEVIVLEGVVRDGAGQPVPDAMIEIWQANAAGRYCDSADCNGFIGFGRSSTSEQGLYRFRTLRPGRIGADQAPHIAVSVFGRGLIKRLATRIYFEGDVHNARDAILALVPGDRRHTLMARQVGEVWRFDIVLQGEAETVFFDI